MDAYEKAAQDLQMVARHFADRQNSDSTLKASECTKLVNTCLNGGNLIEQIVRDRKTAATASDKLAANAGI